MAKVDLEKHDLNSNVTVDGEYLYSLVKELKAARKELMFSNIFISSVKEIVNLNEPDFPDFDCNKLKMESVIFCLKNYERATK